MTEPRIVGVRSVDCGVRDVAASTKFYTEVWGLTPVAQSSEGVYLRGTGRDHHILSLTQHEKPAILGLDLLAGDRAAVEALATRLRGAGVADVTVPAAMSGPGGGYGFRFTDPEGRHVRILCEAATHAAAEPAGDRPSRIVHVVLNSADMDAASQFYCDFLGFSLINRIKPMCFLQCNADHHSLAFAAGDASTMNHIAFAMQDVAAVRRGTERMLEHGLPIGWGIGKHTAGEDVYAYFESPDGSGIEYITKVARDWDGAASGTPHWDEAPRPTPKQAEAMRRVPFAGPPFAG